ncbi:auxin-responsive protein SAUR77-like [Aristolochia californica]|uniref:auxin-responsive protein SAUR77-like n=1 Tax=Aristolochia californica TaxID=171875 RepID=UPI0035E1C6F3
MKKMNVLLRKCKSLSKLGRSSSYSSLRSKTSREDFWGEMTEEEQREAVFVGSSRRRYMINAKLLDHPLLNALIEKSKHNAGDISVKCEVVIFDHLLWMLENADPEASAEPESFEELAELYAY